MPHSQRAALSNLLLLCLEHHQQVDDHPDEFSVEYLQQIKADHEQWVAGCIGAPNAAEQVAREIYNGLIESALRNLEFSNWPTWSIYLTISHPVITWDMLERFNAFTQDVLTAAWPHHNQDFEASAKHLGKQVDAIDALFRQHGESLGSGRFGIIRFYRFEKAFSDEYENALDKYKELVTKIAEHMFEATKAANWLCDIVRRDFDPAFMPRKLQIEEYPPAEFTAEDKTD